MPNNLVEAQENAINMKHISDWYSKDENIHPCANYSETYHQKSKVLHTTLGIRKVPDLFHRLQLML